MYSAKLFLGLPVNNELAAHLAKIDPKILSFFIQKEENYLQEVFFQKKHFLGKSVDKAVDLSSLEMLELNIYSLLKKLVPHYPFENTSLLLFPLQDDV